MIKQSKLKKNYQNVLVGIVCIVFILGFYMIGYVFELSTIKTKTVVLSDDLFHHSLIETNKDNLFEITSVTKLTNDYEIYDPKIIDHNAIVFHKTNQTDYGLDVAVLHLDDNQFIDLGSNTSFGIALSPDETRIIFAGTETDNTLKTYTFDAQSYNQLNVSDNILVSDIFFTDNEHYVGFSGDHFMRRNVTTGHLEEIISYHQLLNASNDPNAYIINFSKGNKSNEVYFLIGNNSETGLLKLNIDNVTQIEKVIQGEMIDQFAVLTNEDILVRGKINNKEGLFLYQMSTGEFHLLQEGVISDFALNNEEKIIAYMVINNTQLSGNKQLGDLHVAYVENMKLNAATVVYRNITFNQDLLWYENSLFSISNLVEKSELFRFGFTE